MFGPWKQYKLISTKIYPKFIRSLCFFRSTAQVNPGILRVLLRYFDSKCPLCGYVGCPDRWIPLPFSELMSNLLFSGAFIPTPRRPSSAASRMRARARTSWSCCGRSSRRSRSSVRRGTRSWRKTARSSDDNRNRCFCWFDEPSLI